MTDTGDKFIPRSRGSAVVNRLLSMLDRYLTPIALGVAIIGTLLMVLGPAQALLTSRPPTNQGESTVAGGQGGLLAAVSGSDSEPSAEQIERRLQPYTIIPDRPRDEITTYTVKPGDTLIGIANRYNLDRTTLFWANTDTLRGDVHMLRPGIDLYILPTDGVYHKANGDETIEQIAANYSVEPEAILNTSYNDLEGYTAADAPPWGRRILVPGGQGEFADWRPPIQETVDEATGQRVSAFMPNMAGSCAPGIQGSGGTSLWANPLAGASFTQPYYPGHSGVDLAAPVGTPITAADTGVVVFSGWVPADWGYGILVVLNHGNGFTTYYAHMSTTGVRCGQVVPRGGYVGQVGSTGNSSGPHLHFEVRWGHEPVNPAGYMGF